MSPRKRELLAGIATLIIAALFPTNLIYRIGIDEIFRNSWSSFPFFMYSIPSILSLAVTAFVVLDYFVRNVISLFGICAFSLLVAFSASYLGIALIQIESDHATLMLSAVFPPYFTIAFALRRRFAD